MESKILDIIPELISIFICAIVSKLMIEKSLKLKMSLLSSFAHSFTIIFLGTVIGFMPVMITLMMPAGSFTKMLAIISMSLFPILFTLCAFIVFKPVLKTEDAHQVSKKSRLYLSLSFTLTYFLLFFASIYIEDIFLQNSL